MHAGIPRDIVPIVAIALVNTQGDVLLQLRSSTARAEPNCWTPPGGHVEPGESPEAAIHREVREETALTLEDPPLLYWRGVGVRGAGGQTIDARLYYGRTTAEPREVMCLEGAAMEFIRPGAVDALRLTTLYGWATRRFMRSPQYRRIAP